MKVGQVCRGERGERDIPSFGEEPPSRSSNRSNSIGSPSDKREMQGRRDIYRRDRSSDSKVLTTFVLGEISSSGPVLTISRSMIQRFVQNRSFVPS